MVVQAAHQVAKNPLEEGVVRQRCDDVVSRCQYYYTVLDNLSLMRDDLSLYCMNLPSRAEFGYRLYGQVV